jgi:alkylhydroperoxidase family enzyme
MTRIRPLPPEEWPAEMRDALAALRPAGSRQPPPRREGRPKALNALGTLARHPELARAFNTFNGHILFASTLSPRQRELLVLRVASLRESRYEWEQHVFLAADAGLQPDEIDRVARGPDAPEWAELDRALLRSADELIEEGMVSDATWKVLAEMLDEQQVMDLVFTVGAYEVELDDDLRRK